MAAQTPSSELDQGWAWSQSHGFLARWRRTLVRFARTQPLGTAGVVVIAVLLFLAVFAGQVNTEDPTEFGADILADPGADHWFGTNRNGQDVWSRVVYGARPALQIGVGSVAVSLLVATILALLAGYFGGLVDTAISRLIDVFICLPAILWALILKTAATDIPGLGGHPVRTLIFAISIGLIPIIARILRGNVIQESSRPYVESARVIGANEFRIMFTHILPNLSPLMIVVASATLPAAILAESGLSFIGLGLESGEASWGTDLGGQNRALFRTYWWLPVFPGIALSLAVLAFNLLGDSLRDTLDPRLRGVR